MLKRTLAALFITVALFVGVSASYVAESAGVDGEPGFISEDVAKEPKKGGNVFKRALKSPFKAISRLFGGGKNNDNKPQRITKKDIKKFESASAYRVNDARTPAPSPLLDSEDNGAGELMAEGRALLANGRASEAVVLLSRAVSIEPSLAEAHHLLGVAYSRKGLHDLSKTSFERAVRLTPNHVEMLNDYGYALYVAGDLKNAVKRLKRAAKLAPASQRIWNNLAVLQCRLGDYDDAYKSFARVGGEYQGRMNVASLLIRAGRAEDAIKHYEAALALKPGATLVLEKLAELYERTGRGREAEAARRALTTPDGRTHAMIGGGG